LLPCAIDCTDTNPAIGCAATRAASSMASDYICASASPPGRSPPAPSAERRTIPTDLRWHGERGHPGLNMPAWSAALRLRPYERLGWARGAGRAVTFRFGRLPDTNARSSVTVWHMQSSSSASPQFPWLAAATTANFVRFCQRHSSAAYHRVSSEHPPFVCESTELRSTRVICSLPQRQDALATSRPSLAFAAAIHPVLDRVFFFWPPSFSIAHRTRGQIRCGTFSQKTAGPVALRS